MSGSTWLHPSMWRVVIFALILGLCANALLYLIAADDDWFAKVISIGSGLTAIGLFVCWLRYPRFIGEALLMAFALWSANIIEFALEDRIFWYSRLRQCLLYGSQALLALGAYVASREASK